MMENKYAEQTSRVNSSISIVQVQMEMEIFFDTYALHMKDLSMLSNWSLFVIWKNYFSCTVLHGVFAHGRCMYLGLSRLFRLN